MTSIDILPAELGSTHRLGYLPMDDIHEEFLDLLATLREAADAELAGALAALGEHLHSHFAEEDGWMKQHDFPARECHMAEHQAVLRSLEGVQRRLAQGDLDAVRRFSATLAGWFPGHADYLDSALAHWLCRQRLRGKPVLLRRRGETPHRALLD